MFDRCYSLKTIKMLGNVSNVTTYTNMFTGVSSSSCELIINCEYQDKWNDMLVTNQSTSVFPSTWTIECETVTE